MKVKWIKQGIGIGYGYFEGDEIDVNDSLAAELTELGYVVAIHTKPTELPENFPGRKVLIDNGFTTINEIKKLSVDDLILIKGIGKKLAELIVNF